MKNPTREEKRDKRSRADSKRIGQEFVRDIFPGLNQQQKIEIDTVLLPAATMAQKAGLNYGAVLEGMMSEVRKIEAGIHEARRLRKLASMTEFNAVSHSLITQAERLEAAAGEWL